MFGGFPSIIEIKNASSLAFVKAISIYEHNIEACIRTNSNEIAYWLERNNKRKKGKLFCLGYKFNDEIIGYAQFIHFKDERIIFFDYLVLDEHYRKRNLYFDFIEQIKSFIEEKSIFYDYIVAEVSHMTMSEQPTERAQYLIRLFKFSEFRIAGIKYYQPPLGVENYESDMPATLLFYAKEIPDYIKTKTLLKIVHIILFDHYAFWYSIYSETINDYKKLISKRYENIERALKGKNSIKLNGYRYAEIPPSSYSQPPYSQRDKYKRVAVVIVILIVLFLLAVSTAVLDKFFEISPQLLISILLALLSIFVLILSIFRVKTISWIEVMLEFLGNFFSK